MKFVKVEWDSRRRGFSIDPNAYLAELPTLVPELPKGARAFASAPGHFDFGSPSCVKDLQLVGVSMVADSECQRLGSVLLDELLPSRHGCRHEITLTGGLLSVSCADLDANWID